MSYQRHAAIHHNQQGFASLVIALIMILVLALLTIGFAELARNEQQSALSKQLADQAYYAAESGVNDITKAIADGTIITSGPNATPGINTNNCLGGPLMQNNRNVIDNSSDVSYSCAIVKLELPSHKFDNVNERSSVVDVFTTSGDLNSLKISWGSAKNRNTPRLTGGFPALNNWGNSPGVLQVSITPLTSYRRDDMINSTFTAYLYPLGNGLNTVAYPPIPGINAGNAPIVSGACNVAVADFPCSTTITGLPGNNGDGYLVRIVNYYDVTNITIGDAKDVLGNRLLLKDGQVQIDVTGKAKNVLKRIRVYKTLKPRGPDPEDTAEVQNLCKRIMVYDGRSDPYDNLDPSCQLSN